MIENGMVLAMERGEAERVGGHWYRDRNDEMVLEFAYTDEQMCRDALAEHLGIKGVYNKEAMTELFYSSLSEDDQIAILSTYINSDRLTEEHFNEWFNETYRDE